MTLTLNLSEEMERRLESEAERRGLPAPELALEIIQNALHLDTDAQKRANEATLELLRKWETDTAEDPAEAERRRRQWEEFAKAMNTNRVESEGPGARIPYP
jgi:hypothetical protein